MRALVSGSSGFIGRALCAYLRERGYEVVPLHRGERWNPDQGTFVKEDFEGFDAVIHLAGEPLLSGRWSRAKKKKILFSRTVSTWLLSHICAQLLHPPKVFLSASAVGYYGDRGEEILTEESSAGSNFLANVCREWEMATQAIASRGARTAQLRFGMVLGARGGALQKLLLPYRLGLGATLGSGQQWISWIALSDLLSAIDFLLHSDSCSGPINCVSPCPVRQKEFAKILAKSLHRPLFLTLPAPLLRWVFGPAAQELMLASTRAEPKKLQQARFAFQSPFLTDALQGILD